MTGTRTYSEIDSATFARLYHARAPHLMWFLGAGASAASGLPTAAQLILRFQKLIYCSRTQSRLSEIDEADATVRARLVEHFKSFPVGDVDDDDYSRYFQAAFAEPEDRRRQLAELMASALPTYGHKVLGALASIDRLSCVWTTNFDQLVETACANVLGTTAKLAVIDLERQRAANRVVRDREWPALFKLHGDFQSDVLKNTAAELQGQDGEHRRAFVDAGMGNGVVVVGYSGRDRSVIDAFRAVVESGSGFPKGLFWCLRPGEAPSVAVDELLRRAAAHGIEAAVVRSGAFDELMGNVGCMFAYRANVQKHLEPQALTNRHAPFATGSSSVKVYPVTRLNAVRLYRLPTRVWFVPCMFRRDDLSRATLERCQLAAAVKRTKGGLLVLGDVNAVCKALGSLAVGPAEERDMPGSDGTLVAPQNLGLLRHGLARALEASTALARRGTTLVVDPKGGHVADAVRAVTGEPFGRIPQTKVQWAEGVRLHITVASERIWVVFSPTIWAEIGTEAEDDARKEFIRKRKAARFNPKWNQLLDVWATVLTGGNGRIIVPIPGGTPDMCFELGAVTAFSWTRVGEA